MPDVRYVCLSDLHFGAENSILTGLVPGKVEVDVCTPSRVLTRLIDCLASVIDQNEGSRRPTLILAGDILELALATDNEAAMVFEMFVQQAFGRKKIFDDTVYFIPGNHDHHLWEGAREKQYSDYVRSRSGPLEPPWHTTRMRVAKDPDPVESELLTALVYRRLGPRTRVRVRIVYPNLALDTATSNRHVFIHHGQFVEAMYTAMSSMQDMVFPNQIPPPWMDTPVWDWEAENFAWIDFFWSTLGRSGAVGRDVGVIYASLQSREALRPLNRNLARGLSEKAPGPKCLRGISARVLAWVLDRTANRATQLERGRKEFVLSPAAQKGLQVYVESPLIHQIKREYNEYKQCDRVPDDVTFVFGHTHKPFEAVRRFAGYERPVCVYNTGGWVVDTTEPRPLHGAAAILFDEDLNSASLRFFNQSGDQSSYRVAVAHCGPPNPFSTKLAALVDPEADPWMTFSRDAAKLVQERHQALYRIITQAQGVAPSRRAIWRRWRERGWRTR